MFSQVATGVSPTSTTATMDPLFTATVQATEEAIINALLAATQVTGPDNFTATKLPADKLVAAFNQYNPMTAIFLD